MSNAFVTIKMVLCVQSMIWHFVRHPVRPESLDFRGTRHRRMKQGVTWSNHGDLVNTRHKGADDGVETVVLPSWRETDPFHGQAFFFHILSVCIFKSFNRYHMTSLLPQLQLWHLFDWCPYRSQATCFHKCYRLIRLELLTNTEGKPSCSFKGREGCRKNLTVILGRDSSSAVAVIIHGTSFRDLTVFIFDL